MKRISAMIVSAMTALSAALMLPISSASAADGKMTLELTAAERYFTESDLKDTDKVVSGALWIRNYTDTMNLKTVLTSTAPVTIENGHFTEPGFFEAASANIYTTPEESVIPGKGNIIVWQGPDDNNFGVGAGKIANPDSSFCEFDVHIAKGTKAGVYTLGFGHDDGENPDTYATYDGKDIPMDFNECRIVVEPEALRGDTNCDGQVTIEDVKGALDYHVATNLTMLKADEAMSERLFKTPYVHSAQKAADAKQDGTINDRDAMLILRYVSAGLANLPQDWDALK